MNRTIYIRDEDVSVWERARELAGDKLSPVIVDGLKQFIMQREAEIKDFERIEVRYNDSEARGMPKAKAFFGRWIYPKHKPLGLSGASDGNRYAAVAVTAKGGVVVFLWTTDGESCWHEIFRVFPSLEQAVFDSETNYPARMAIEALGVPVEVLDI